MAKVIHYALCIRISLTCSRFPDGMNNDGNVRLVDAFSAKQPRVSDSEVYILRYSVKSILVCRAPRCTHPTPTRFWILHPQRRFASANEYLFILPGGATPMCPLLPLGLSYLHSISQSTLIRPRPQFYYYFLVRYYTSAVLTNPICTKRLDEKIFSDLTKFCLTRLRSFQYRPRISVELEILTQWVYVYDTEGFSPTREFLCNLETLFCQNFSC